MKQIINLLNNAFSEAGLAYNTESCVRVVRVVNQIVVDVFRQTDALMRYSYLVHIAHSQTLRVDIIDTWLGIRHKFLIQNGELVRELESEKTDDVVVTTTNVPLVVIDKQIVPQTALVVPNRMADAVDKAATAVVPIPTPAEADASVVADFGMDYDDNPPSRRLINPDHTYEEYHNRDSVAESLSLWVIKAYYPYTYISGRELLALCGTAEATAFRLNRPYVLQKNNRVIAQCLSSACHWYVSSEGHIASGSRPVTYYNTIEVLEYLTMKTRDTQLVRNDSLESKNRVSGDSIDAINLFGISIITGVPCPMLLDIIQKQELIVYRSTRVRTAHSYHLQYLSAVDASRLCKYLLTEVLPKIPLETHSLVNQYIRHTLVNTTPIAGVPYVDVSVTAPEANSISASPSLWANHGEYPEKRITTIEIGMLFDSTIAEAVAQKRVIADRSMLVTLHNYFNPLVLVKTKTSDRHGVYYDVVDLLNKNTERNASLVLQRTDSEETAAVTAISGVSLFGIALITGVPMEKLITWCALAEIPTWTPLKKGTRIRLTLDKFVSFEGAVSLTDNILRFELDGLPEIMRIRLSKFITGETIVQ